MIDREEIVKVLKKEENIFAYVEDIFEDDFGCEERQPGEMLKVIVKLITREGSITFRAKDEELIRNHIDVGSFVYKEYRDIFESV